MLCICRNLLSKLAFMRERGFGRIEREVQVFSDCAKHCWYNIIEQRTFRPCQREITEVPSARVVYGILSRNQAFLMFEDNQGWPPPEFRLGDQPGFERIAVGAQYHTPTLDGKDYSGYTYDPDLHDRLYSREEEWYAHKQRQRADQRARMDQAMRARQENIDAFMRRRKT